MYSLPQIITQALCLIILLIACLHSPVGNLPEPCTLTSLQVPGDYQLSGFYIKSTRDSLYPGPHESPPTVSFTGQSIPDVPGFSVVYAGGLSGKYKFAADNTVQINVYQLTPVEGNFWHGVMHLLREVDTYQVRNCMLELHSEDNIFYFAIIKN